MARPGTFPVIAIAASVGGIHALRTVVGQLPGTLAAAAVVLLHLSPDRRSLLPDILQRTSALPVVRAGDGDPLAPGRVFTIPEGRHAVVDRAACLHLLDAGPMPPVRPSADLLFCSLAAALGDRAVAVVLTGSGRDGALGCAAVQACGGTVVVEDPASAEDAGMPSAALAGDPEATVLPLEAIAGHLTGLLVREVPGPLRQEA